MIATEAVTMVKKRMSNGFEPRLHHKMREEERILRARY